MARQYKQCLFNQASARIQPALILKGNNYVASMSNTCNGPILLIHNMLQNKNCRQLQDHKLCVQIRILINKKNCQIQAIIHDHWASVQKSRDNSSEIFSGQPIINVGLEGEREPHWSRIPLQIAPLLWFLSFPLLEAPCHVS